MNGTTYILTAELDDSSFTWLDALRRQHFPPERNVLSAHLTMFHLLSGAQIERLPLAMPHGPIDLDFDRVRFLGAGVAFNVRSPGLAGLRDQLIVTMGGELSRQDSQKWSPHVTVQNKVAAASARELCATLGETFTGRTGHVRGLQVWEYLNGPWKLARRISFEPVVPQIGRDCRHTS
jgi:hypothetical protein